MADQGADWTSPGGGPRRDADPPRYGERIPGWTSPAEQQPAPVVPQAYTPPPKPGLVPLHPLSFGQLLGGAFQVIRYNPRATVAPALIISFLQNLLVLGLTYGIGIATFDRVERATNDADRAAIALGGAATGGAAALAVIVASVIATALLQGILTRVVADGVLGRRPTAGEALRAAGRRFWPLVGYSLLLGVIQLVLVLVLAASVVGLVVAFSGVANDIGILYAVLIAIPIGLALLVVYGFFAVKFALAPSAIVLERKPVLASIRRSWTLTRRAFWRTFGLLALVTIMVSAAAQIVSLPFSILGSAIAGLLYPNSGGDVQSTLVTALVSSIPGVLVTVVVTGIGQIAQVGAIVLVYLDRRMRTEGLDLELRRFVEQGGDDPYERIG
ncbi:DUF7847 domain-containing protein [Amnibacterium setariae]|uniref:DUF7847 domain-containing protein n=1 Tax=Amnibacterium setariae TaxID=2306585 RepID=A0A3A1U4I0_9MICO|nr:hypothetical protein [Amnibacterium setariae]RIX28757.1 hypothetical protein D1781_15315 [Amnibacterium setariae]